MTKTALLSIIMSDLCWGVFFRTFLFHEGLAKEPPQIGLPGGQNLSWPPTTLLPYIRPSQRPYKGKSEK